MTTLIQKFKEDYPTQLEEARLVFSIRKKEFLNELDLELEDQQKIQLIENEHKKIKEIYQDKVEVELLKLLNSDPKKYKDELLKNTFTTLPHLTQRQGMELLGQLKQLKPLKDLLTSASDETDMTDFLAKAKALSNSQVSDRLIHFMGNAKSFKETNEKAALTFFIADEQKKYFDFLKKLHKEIKNPDAIQANFPPVKNPNIVQLDQVAVEEFLHKEMDFLQGVNLRKNIILPREQFESLYSKTLHLIMHQQLPPVDERFEPQGISKTSIAFLYHRIYKELLKTKDFRSLCIQFLHAFFIVFDSNEIKSTIKKFGKEPNKYPF